jgi:hypothetical protein
MKRVFFAFSDFNQIFVISDSSVRRTISGFQERNSGAAEVTRISQRFQRFMFFEYGSFIQVRVLESFQIVNSDFMISICLPVLGFVANIYRKILVTSLNHRGLRPLRPPFICPEPPKTPSICPEASKTPIHLP